MFKQMIMFAVVAGLVLALAPVAQAVDYGVWPMPTVSVGNLNNSGDTYGAPNLCGAVDYAYSIGTYEVTAGQYCDFLNAVAATDTYGLYNSSMDSSIYGCQITQNNTSGSYAYDFSGGTAEAPGSTASDWANRPVNDVSWNDAAQFCNWLTTGSATSGYYTITAGVASIPGQTHKEYAEAHGPTYFIPTMAEWYKAAYHKNDGDTGNYFKWPTSSDTAPSIVLTDPDPGNNATSGSGATIGSPYYRTEVGAHENSQSAYGTFDQAGNVWEQTEAISGSNYIFRGSAWWCEMRHFPYRDSSWEGVTNRSPSHEEAGLGFRVSEVIPEPATLALLGLGGLGLLLRRRRA